MKRTLINKCECCGALFNGDTCGYCNARYVFEEMADKPRHGLEPTYNNDIQSHHISLRYGNKEIDFYVSDISWDAFSYGECPTLRLNLVSYGEMRDIDENNVK